MPGIDDPGTLLAGRFSHAPVGSQISTADSHSILTNPKFCEIFGSQSPRGCNALHDEQAAKVSVLDLIRGTFAGETVTTVPSGTTRAT